MKPLIVIIYSCFPFVGCCCWFFPGHVYKLADVDLMIVTVQGLPDQNKRLHQ